MYKRYTTIFITSCVLGMLALVTTCDGDAPITGSVEVESYIVPMYMLYLAEAKFPEAIYEDEPFEVEFKFSAAATPELLGGGMESRCYSYQLPLISNPPEDADGGYGMAFWFTAKTQDEETGDSITCQFDALPAGTWVFRILSTETPELAGQLHEIDLLNGEGLIMYSGITYQEYRIEVVPRTDDET